MSIIINEPNLLELAEWMPWPSEHANKYTRGRLVIVGGSAAYPGAACLSAEAALRMGAGYVEVACSPETLPILHAHNPNVVARSWQDWSPAASQLDEAPDEMHPRACLVGSGMDSNEQFCARLVFSILEDCACTVVVDGGGITFLASEKGRKLAIDRAKRGLAMVVTPHFGEAARLGEPFGLKPPVSPADDERSCAMFAQQLADAYSCTVMLKGHHTFVASAIASARGAACAGEIASAEASAKDDGRGADDAEFEDAKVDVMTRGTAALAKAGTGDVLAGMTAAIVAQGVPAHHSANLACRLHAEAGRHSARTLTEICVCASDLPNYIPMAIDSLR